jgi:hypothetical protein
MNEIPPRTTADFQFEKVKRQMKTFQTEMKSNFCLELKHVHEDAGAACVCVYLLAI